jgi:16S rRNA (cytidine1402-2'-O)-methyltransferase
MPAGRLHIVSTPIGNLGDLSERAIETLRAADRVACEDTRHTGRLLARLGIEQRLVSLHEHNEASRLPRLIERLEEGETIALVSDAGTPLLSDPGYLLVRESVARGIAVSVVPGPSAVTAALALSGLPPHPFTFLGFPPPKSGRRRRFFARWADAGHTLILFESPHRILPSLRDLRIELGNRPVALAREMTKLHEEVVRGPLDEVIETLAARPGVKGELVVVVGAGGDDS